MPSAYRETIHHTPASVPEANTDGRGGVIGLFDSGVGGLSVLRSVARQLPEYNLVYFADQKYCPYGPRPAQEIQALSERITQFLITHTARIVVVACNTASAAALYYLRERFPQTIIVGMEPAVKPAAGATRTGKVAVLATQGTFAGELFANTRSAFAQDVEVLTVYPHDWVERVERGEIDTLETYASVRAVIEPLLDAGVDEIALGCTHYPFLAPLIEQVAQGRATILDPSEAVARQTRRHVTEIALPPSRMPDKRYYTTGDAVEFARVLGILLDTPAPRVIASGI